MRISSKKTKIDFLKYGLEINLSYFSMCLGHRLTQKAFLGTIEDLDEFGRLSCIGQLASLLYDDISISIKPLKTQISHVTFEISQCEK